MERERLFTIEESPTYKRLYKKAMEKEKKDPWRKEEKRIGKIVSESIKKDIEKNVREVKNFEKYRRNISKDYEKKAMNDVVNEKTDKAIKNLAISYALGGGKKFNEGVVAQNKGRAERTISDIIRNRDRERLIGAYRGEVGAYRGEVDKGVTVLGGIFNWITGNG